MPMGTAWKKNVPLLLWFYKRAELSHVIKTTRVGLMNNWLKKMLRTQSRRQAVGSKRVKEWTVSQPPWESGAQGPGDTETKWTHKKRLQIHLTLCVASAHTNIYSHCQYKEKKTRSLTNDYFHNWFFVIQLLVCKMWKTAYFWSSNGFFFFFAKPTV